MGETRTGDYMFYSVEKCTDKDSDKAYEKWIFRDGHPVRDDDRRILVAITST
jgi:hypothetical protein